MVDSVQKTPFDTYKDLLDECFGKIKKTLPVKKYKELLDLCTVAHEQVQQLKEDKEQLSANKYFYIFKLALESKIPRLMEFLLYRIQKLFTYEFLDGNCEDNCKYSEENKPPEKNGRLNRLLIDAIVESICECAHERDNQVQLQVIKALLTIVIAINSKVHERTLLEAFKTQYSIHITSTSQVNKNTAKASLTQMINVVFSKMDSYMRYGSQETIDLRKLAQTALIQTPLSSRSSGQINLLNNQPQVFDQQSLQSKLSSHSKPTEIEIKDDTSRSSSKQEEIDTSNQNASSAARNSIVSAASVPADVTFTQLDQYVFSVVQNLVDNVCLHDARVKSVIKKHGQIDEAQDDENPQHEEEGDFEGRQIDNNLKRISLEEEISRIPLNPIPYSKNDCPEVHLQNELGIDAGRFGWCIVCRNTANLYCKDTKHPVCSQECKKKHLTEANALDGPAHDNLPSFNKLDEANLAYTDAILVFRSIVKLSVGGDGNQAANQQVNPFAMRTKIIGLELILAVLEKPKQPFLTKKAFIDEIKNRLCEGLLRYSVSNEKTVFSLVASIFFCLFLHFRKHLKSVILVFIETIFLKLLDSSNSSFHHKELILNVFDKISQNSMMMLEIFVNYDCDIAQKDITKHIVESLSKIANGKFKQSEHSSIISAQEEPILRRHSTQILVQMLRSFNATIDAEIAESKLTSRMIQKGMIKVEKDIDLQNNQSMDQDSNHNRSGQMNTSGIKEDDTSYDSIGRAKKNTQFEDLQKQRNLKEQHTIAAQKFNQSWKAGIKQLVSQELIPNHETNYRQHVVEIVNFLKITPTLSKTKIGEFLGEDKTLNKDCLMEFIDQYDLKAVEFVIALKTILQGFRLPGEGQIVDRVMERFGEKFVADNPHGSDSTQGNMSAECVYLLSYATMMMQTSLHNPNAIKSRMTLEDFAKMLKGINSGGNLNEAFIRKIYEHVERDPFTLNEDDDARIKQEAANANSLKRKQDLFQKEGMGLIKRGKVLIAQQSNKTFITVEDCKAIRPLFENTWTPNLVTFSRILEETNDEEIATLCIEGFAHSIKICGYYNMTTEREAFVSSLAKFTQVSNERRIKSKHIQVIQKIIELATYQGNYLGESWLFVLECVSKLEEMINLGSGQMKDRDFFDTQLQQTKDKSRGQSQVTAQMKAQREATMLANSELVVQNISMAQIDGIFQGSINLDQDAIIFFIENLCKVSKTELSDTLNPRKFSLQCLVEVADLNMARIRFVWSKIWQMLSAHFIEVGSHPNLMVSIFAIDSLRQLADKFLLKEEFKKFNFQKDFLKPFESIMLNNLHTRTDIKEYIVMCITNISGTKTVYIKSGWSVIINIFTLAAQDNEELLVQQSFAALKLAVTQHFDVLEEGFVELVNCLNKYSMNTMFKKQSQEAQHLLLLCAEKLQDVSILNTFAQKQGLMFYQSDQKSLCNYPPQYGLAATHNSKTQKTQDMPNEDQFRLSTQKGLWFPILTNLTNLSMDKNTENQAFAVEILFQVLQKGVEVFDLSFWREILSQVFLPILEDIDLAIENQSRKIHKNERTFLLNTILLMVDKFNRFIDRNVTKMQCVLSSYVDIVLMFLSKTQSGKIIEVLVKCYSKFFMQIANHLGKTDWDSITESLELCYDITCPVDLIQQCEELMDAEEMVDRLEKQFSKSQVQAFLVELSYDLMTKHYQSFSVKNIQTLIRCLEKTNKTARDINSQFDIRVRLWNFGLSAEHWHLPSLIEVESRSIATILTLKFLMYFNPKDLQPQENEKVLFELCKNLLTQYSQNHSEMLEMDDIHRKNSTGQFSMLDCKLPTHSSSSRSILSNLAEEKSENAFDRSTEHANRPVSDAIANDHKSGSAEDKLKQQRKERESVPISQWHLNDQARRIEMTTPLIIEIILENFGKLSDNELMKHQKVIGPLLIDLSICNNHPVRTANKLLLVRIFKLLNSQLPE